MALPTQRRTSSSKRRRASHFALKEGAYNFCPKCKKPVKPHKVCRSCGVYKGKEVIDTSRSLKRKAKK